MQKKSGVGKNGLQREGGHGNEQTNRGRKTKAKKDGEGEEKMGGGGGLTPTEAIKTNRKGIHEEETRKCKA